MYAKQLYVGWGDLDANGHMRNTAYLDRAADVRMFFFAEHGFPVREFAQLGLGPVIRQDTLEYRRECYLLEPIRVTLAIQALSADASRFVIVNEFLRGESQLAARVVSLGGWLDQRARALVAPPPALAEVLRTAPRTGDFVELPGLASD